MMGRRADHFNQPLYKFQAKHWRKYDGALLVAGVLLILAGLSTLSVAGIFIGLFLAYSGGIFYWYDYHIARAGFMDDFAREVSGTQE